jgi:hypothetical protein
MRRNVDAVTASKPMNRNRSDLLLRHCLALGAAERRTPAKVRLEEALGPELTQRLLASLTAPGRR